MTKQVDTYPVITGLGQAFPERALSNADLIEVTGIISTPERITELTGINNRYWTDEGQVVSGLASSAAAEALLMAGIEPSDISSLYVATTTPDYVSVNTASIVHETLGAPEDCYTVDLKAACAGGVMALDAASNRLRLEQDNSTALVIGANMVSKFVDKSDRRTVILFGDGAGAATVTMRQGANRPYSTFLTRPNRAAINIPAGGMAEHRKSIDDPRGKIHMNGPMVKENAIDVMTRSSVNVAKKAGLYDESRGVDWDSIDFLVPHQANARLIEAVGEELKVPSDQCIITVNEHANTSSASVFLALSEAHKDGRIPAGRSRVLFTAIGAGFVGGAVLMDVDLP